MKPERIQNLWRLPIVAVLALLGCSPQPDAVRYQRHLVTFAVHLELADQAATRRQCVKLGTWGSVEPVGAGPYGCNLYDPASNAIIIYATAPERVDDAYTTLLGHELLHAYGGAYHAGFDQ